MLHKHTTRRHPLKWILAGILFVLVLTVTFDDAYGVWVPSSGDGQEQAGNAEPVDQQFDINTTPIESQSTAPQIPEPATLILLGAGLAGWQARRYFKTR